MILFAFIYNDNYPMKKKSSDKLSPLELEIMQVLWKLESASIREVQEALPKRRKVEYTTVQTIVYRLEKKNAVKRTKKIGNAHIFEPTVTRKSAIGSLVDDFLSLFGGSAEPLMVHMAESGKLTLEDLKALEEAIKKSEKGEGGK
jgi:predicted transcriptional regulator